MLFIPSTCSVSNRLPLVKRFIRKLLAVSMAAALWCSTPVTAMAQSAIQTNQSWVEGLQQSASLEINTLEGALSHVFSGLPDQVFVYPTENYYYFTFPAGGIIYAGNLRLAAQDRDKGVIHFAAFAQANQSSEAGEMMYKPLTADDGVTVEKQTEFSYRVTYRDKAVVFQLNDTSKILPPDDIIAEGEKYLGAIADESGLRFFLFYNEIHKTFAYVLDETGDVLDGFSPVTEESRILVGHRTGFAVYDHHYLDRRVLIGVHGSNTVVNNYYDGPADQLPENHIKDDNLRLAIVDSNPEMQDKLDEFGYYKTGEGRYLITPYIQYQAIEELAVYNECADDPKLEAEFYDACFISGDQ